MALDFFAGCVGGCAGILVGHPFDTIKVQLQTQDFRNPKYRGTLHCFKTIVQKESMVGLYRGMSSPMSGVAVINAIVFGVYGNMQRRMNNPDALSSHFLAGVAAGFAQSFVCSPMELAKTRVQVQQTQTYRSPLHCLIQISRTEGIRGLFRGLGMTMAREMPGVGIYFLSYEMMTRTSSPEPISTLHVLSAGGMAGCISWVATYPMDVLKSRIQIDGMNGVARYKGVMDCLRQSIRNEGYSFLSRGLSSTLLRAFPMNAATFGVVTWIFRLAGVGLEEDSGYYVGTEYEIDSTNMMLQHPVAERVMGIRVAGLWEHWETREKYMKGLFHWRKLMMHNMGGHFFISPLDSICPRKHNTEQVETGLVSKIIHSDIKPEMKTGDITDSEQEHDTMKSHLNEIAFGNVGDEHKIIQSDSSSIKKNEVENVKACEGTAQPDVVNSKHSPMQSVPDLITYLNRENDKDMILKPSIRKIRSIPSKENT